MNNPPQIPKSNVPLWYDVLTKIYPCDGVLVVGSGLSRWVNTFIHSSASTVIFVEEDESQIDRIKKTFTLPSHWEIVDGLISNLHKEEMFYYASNTVLNGTIVPETLSSLWPNVFTRKQELRESITISQLLDNRDIDSNVNWFVLDSFSALDALEGAKSRIEECDIVIVRALSDNAMISEAKIKQCSIDTWMESAGFCSIVQFEENHPHVSLICYVRNWKAGFDQQSDSIEILLKDINKLSSENVDNQSVYEKTLKEVEEKLELHRLDSEENKKSLEVRFEKLSIEKAEIEDRSSKEIEELQRTIVLFQDEKAQSEAGREESVQQINSLNEELVNTQKSRNGWKSKAETYEVTLKEVEEKLELHRLDSEENKKSLEARFEKLSIEKAEIEDRSSKEIEELQRTIVLLQDEKAQSEAGREESVQQINSLNEDLNVFKIQNSNLQDEQVKLEHQIATINAELGETKISRNFWKTKVETLETLVKDLEQAVEKQKNVFVGLQQDSENFINELNETKQALLDSKENEEKIRAWANNLKKQLEEKENEISEIKKQVEELNTLVNELESLKQEVVEVREREVKNKNWAQNLKKLLEEKELEIVEYKKNIEEYKIKIDENKEFQKDVYEYKRAKNYFIKPTYVSRTEYTHYDDQSQEDKWQLEVYLHALGLMKKHDLKSVVDLGCGSGYKLMKYLSDYKTIGLELGVNLEFLKEKYPEKTWLESNFEIDHHIKTDVLICSDVIEHIVNPDQLIRYMQKISFKYLILSTPDRELVYEEGMSFLDGPPRNPAHVREWNFAEFKDYIGQYFEIIDHRVTNLQQSTQMIICKKCV